MIYQKLKQVIHLSKNSPTYTAYPTRDQRISNNIDTINIDTVEKNLRLLDRKTFNSSANLKRL